MQAVCCVKVMALLMQQHLRDRVLSSLEAFCGLWRRYAITPGSAAAAAGYPQMPPSGPTQPLSTVEHEEATSGFNDDANTTWRSTHALLRAWGEDLYRPAVPPMFATQLVITNSGGELQLMPNLKELRDAVLGVITSIVEAGQTVEDLGAKVSAQQCISMLLSFVVYISCTVYAPVRSLC